MLQLSRQTPGYLLGRLQLVTTVTFTALFSLLVMLARLPFSNNPWLVLPLQDLMTYAAAFFAICIFIVCLSRRVMYSLRDNSGFLLFHYVAWGVAEVLLLAFLYSFLTVKAGSYGLVDLEGADFLSIFGGAVVSSAISIGMPYVFCGMYFTLEDRNNTIRLMNYGNVVSDVPVQPYEEKRVTLFDNNGVLKMSLNMDSVYFFESDDNYIKVWYMDTAGEVRQYMLRCRLKTIEESFANSDLVRCHRKYIVNITKVSILKSDKDGYCMDLGIESAGRIPISKTYEKAVLARFNSR